MRFTIRDVLWLTAVVAFIVLWRVESHRRSADSIKVQNQIRVLADGQGVANARLDAVAAMEQKIKALEQKLNSMKRKLASVPKPERAP